MVLMRGFIFVIPVALALLASPTVSQAPQTGTLSGTVEVRSPLIAPMEPALGHPTGHNAAAAAQPHRQAVVFFDPAPRGETASPAHATMRQRDATFVPHLLAITVGTTVDFPNDDETYHNVFSLSKTKRFDLGRYAAGRSKAVRFDRPGVVRVFCDIHSQMNAFILVFDHRFHAVTDAEGRYRMDRVPPGTYRVTAWYEGVAQETRSVTIATGASGLLNFALH